MSPDPDRSTVEVVLLVASAGGLDALCTVLEGVPSDYPAAIIVEQHLGGHTSVLASILARRTHHNVCWAVDGQRIGPRQVIVCPPEVYMEVTAAGTCSLRTMKPLRERRFDALLTSAAASYGPRALAVVLSGSGHDGAVGTVAMKQAGGTVIAQGHDAEFSSMPTAAARAGADAVLPASAIGTVLAAIGHRGLDPAGGVGPILADLGIEHEEPLQVRTADLPVRESPHLTPDYREAGDSAAARGEAAGRRIAELQHRQEELAAGRGATAQSAATASARAEEAAHRAEVAQEVAAKRLVSLEEVRSALGQDFHQQ